MRHERVEKEVGKKTPSVVYISPHHPDDPRRVANMTLYPRRRTPELINPADFQLEPSNSIGSTGVEVGGLPLTFETTPTTSSTNMLLAF